MFSDCVIRECHSIKIPCISVCDTTFFPVEAMYHIPGSEKHIDSSIFFNSMFFLFGFKANLMRANIFRKRILSYYKQKIVFLFEKDHIRYRPGMYKRLLLNKVEGLSLKKKRIKKIVKRVKLTSRPIGKKKEVVNPLTGYVKKLFDELMAIAEKEKKEKANSPFFRKVSKKVIPAQTVNKTSALQAPVKKKKKKRR